MLATMLNIPELQQSILVLVLEQENLDRMAKADPVTLESPRLGGVCPQPLFPLRVLVAAETDQEPLYRLAKQGDTAELLTWLQRGSTFIKGKDGAEHTRKL
jgi:hypothetical protein